MKAFETKIVLCTLVFALGLSCRHRPEAVTSDVRVIDPTLGPAPEVMENQSAIELAGAPMQGVVCSFNISFLGHWKDKKNSDLANFLRNCDIAAIQELISTPTKLFFPRPNGSPKVLEADEEAEKFFAAMAAVGFAWSIAPQDTGRTLNQSNGTASEFPVVFYRPDRLEKGDQVKEGYWIEPGKPTAVLVRNPVFDRVPYAFAFRWKLPATTQSATTTAVSQEPRGNDFVIISVHLHASRAGLASGTAQRNKEIATIMEWCAEMERTTGEKDYLFLGDTNIESASAIKSILLQNPGWDTLNRKAAQTNLMTAAEARPYDQVFFKASRKAQIPQKLMIVNIQKPFPAILPTGAAESNAGVAADDRPSEVVNTLPAAASTPHVAQFGEDSADGGLSSSLYIKYYSDHQALYFNYQLQEDND